jgi:hypothetical protein
MKLKIRRTNRSVNMSAEGGWCPTVKEPNVALVHTYAKGKTGEVTSSFIGQTDSKMGNNTEMNLK